MSHVCFAHLVSTAKSRTEDDKAAPCRSFTNTRNGSGPRILPWGTPETTGRRPERWLDADTHCCLLVKQAFNQCQELPVIPHDHSLNKSSL